MRRWRGGEDRGWGMKNKGDSRQSRGAPTLSQLALCVWAGVSKAHFRWLSSEFRAKVWNNICRRQAMHCMDREGISRSFYCQPACLQWPLNSSSSSFIGIFSAILPFGSTRRAPPSTWPFHVEAIHWWLDERKGLTRMSVLNWAVEPNKAVLIALNLVCSIRVASGNNWKCKKTWCDQWLKSTGYQIAESQNCVRERRGFSTFQGRKARKH